jgi:hypothetical protein
MNPILASGLVLATAGVVWFQQQHRLQQLRSAAVTRAEELAVVRTEQDRVSTRQGELEAAVPRLRIELRDLGERLRATPPTEAPSERRRTPELEGRFPADQPYFYLPKALLRNFELEPFEDGQLTAAATVLFQLTEPERLAVNEAYQAREDRVIALETGRVERVDPPERLSGDGVESYVVARLPSLAPELAELEVRFRQAVGEVLGTDRAARFLEHAGAQAALDGPTTDPATREYVLQRHAGGESTLTIRFRSGNRVWWHSQVYPLASAYGLSPFRHLFREPLVLPNPTPTP